MMVRISMALTLAAVAVLLHWIAKDRPERLFFEPLGRPLDENDQRRAKNLRLLNAITAAAAILVLFIADHPAAIIGAILASSLVPAIYLMIALGRSLAASPDAAMPSRFLVPLGGKPTLRSLISVPLQLLNVALIAGGTATFLALKPYLPEKMPIHWNIRGEADGFSDGGDLWILIGIAVFDSALLLLFCWTTAKERWVLPEKNSLRYADLQREKRRLNVLLLERLMVSMNASMIILLLLLALGGIYAVKDLGLMAALLIAPLSTVVILILIARIVPRLTEIADELRAIASTAALGSHPSGWRWNGMIYFAPNDPALWVPKKSGLGQTLNFARPSSWLIVGGSLLLPVIVVLIAAFYGA